MVEVRNEYQILAGKSEGNKPLRRLRGGWDCNIKMNLKETVCGGWTGFIWLRIGHRVRVL
jgi:hypothetical protein